VLPGNNKVDLSLNSPRKKSVTRYQFNKPLTKQQLTTVKPHRLWPTAETLAKSYYSESKSGVGSTVVTIVKDPNFPHPVRIEENVVIHQSSGKETVLKTTQMMADQILARFDGSLSEKEVADLLIQEGMKIAKVFKTPGLYAVTVSEVTLNGVPEGIQDLKKKVANLAYAEPDYLVNISAEPTDPQFHDIWGMNNTGQGYINGYSGTSFGTSGKDVNWLESWEAGDIPVDNHVVVAVIDTGVDYNHADLANQMWTNTAELNGTAGVDDDGNGYTDDIYGIDPLNGDSDPFDDHYHGTHCAGTIAAENNTNGIIGVNPYAKIMALKFLGATGGSSSAAIESIEYAVEMGAKVLSNSWGGGSYSQALQDAILEANDRGVVFVAAGGNSNTAVLTYPAAMEGVVSVGATDSHDVKSSFSNYGNNVDIMAPGTDIISCLSSSGARVSNHHEDDTLLVISGTSMACPMVAGAISVMVAKNPGAPSFSYQGALWATADDIDGLNPGLEEKLGKGRMNIQNYLNYTAETAFVESHLYSEEGNFSPTPGTDGGPGITFGLSAKVAAWDQPITGLSYHVTNISSGLNLLSASSVDIGDLAAFGSYNLPTDTFQIQIKNEDNAPWGSTQTFNVELRQGATVLDTKTFTFKLTSTEIFYHTIANIDGEGGMEIIGCRYSQLFAWNHTGKLIWTAETPKPYDSWTSSSLKLTVGNFSSAHEGLEFITVIQNVMGSDAVIRIYDKDGVFIKDIGDGASDDDEGEGFIGMVSRVSAQDLNGEV